MKPHYPFAILSKKLRCKLPTEESTEQAKESEFRQSICVYMRRYCVGHLHHQDFSSAKQEAERQHDIGHHELKSDPRNSNSENILADFSIFPRKNLIR